MTVVAAIQMTTGADVARNLADAWRLLREARAKDAEIAALPENFALMGHTEQEKLAIAEPPGDGPIQRFLAQAAREFRMWLVAGTIPIATAEPAQVAAACLVFDATRLAPWRATTRSISSTSASRVATNATWSRERCSAAASPSASIRPRAGWGSPSATTCGFRSSSASSDAPAPTGSACRPPLRRPTGPRALGSAAAGARHREPGLHGGAGAVRVPRKRP